MATEYEELKLTVTLADNASAGMTKMHQQLQEMTSGKGATHIEKFKRESSIMRDLLKTMGLEAQGALKSFETLGLRAGAVIGGVATLVAGLVVVGKKLYDFSEGIEKSGQAAELAGVPFANLHNIQRQFYKQLALNEEQSTEIVKAAVAAQVHARRLGSDEMFDDINKQLTRIAPQMSSQIRRMIAAAGPPEEIINAQIRAMRMVDAEIEEREKGKGREQIDIEKAEAHRIILQGQHINVIVAKASELNLLTKEEADRLNELNTNATEYAKTWRSILDTINEVKNLMFSDALDPKSSPVIGLLEKAKDLTDWIFKTMTESRKALEGKSFWEKFFYVPPEVEEFFRKHFGALTETTPRAGVPPPTGAEAPLMSNYGSPFDDRNNEGLGDNTRELKRLNDLLYTMLNPPEPGAGGSANPASGASNDLSGTSATSGSTPSTGSTPSLGPPPPTPNYGPSNPPPAGAFPTPSLFEHTPMGIVPPGGGGGVEGVPTNAEGFIRAIGAGESKLSFNTPLSVATREAYADATNRMSYGRNTSQYDYGYFQMAQRDVDEGVRLGMSIEQAQHLMGGAGRRSSLDQQIGAVNDYLKRRYPEAYRRLIERNDYAGMVDATHTHHGGKEQWKWYGLRDKARESEAEYNKTRDAARISAAGLMGGAPTAGLDLAASRKTIDTASSARVKQLIEGAGHLRIEVPSPQGPAPGAGGLFKQAAPTRAVQMQPATIGPAEPMSSWGG
jgi:hypothetical protein